ncbi:hypothetical protein RchiOBHm_Chr1g0324011 [Rosa chinensis]|uniref:Reverse transcriptase zinc-binding domain-containing protein n=1 Tax=Rosa chinensis TaxID=74649 RepID=A0A2P6S9Q4_ROSCH|nr:hypothetical protein RchiOBHm_Chr1g0324011 [Rosa chinensis]
MLGVPEVPFHERYLGLPTVAGRNNKEMFKIIHERLDSHLQGWQNKLLSKAGKSVLIRAVAQVIPSFTMTVFMLPKGVCRTYQVKVAKYWWGKSGAKRGIHWAKWELLCQHKHEGGLGFRDISCFNQALLAKRVWRLILDANSLVSRILHIKYFWGQSWADVKLGPKPSYIWRSLLWRRDLICEGVRWRIGNGEMVKIRGDRWVPLPWNFKVITPRFLHEDTLVRQLMTQPGEWDTNFINSHFLPVDAERILSIPLVESGGSDVVVWHYCTNGQYTVKSGYWLGMEMKRKELGSGSVCGNGASNSRTIWSLCIPNKFKLLLWRACHAFLPCA